MNWLKDVFTNKKDYPEIWQDYLVTFKEAMPQRVVVLDCETTGLNPAEDKILSIGAIALHKNVICVADCFSVLLQQSLNKPESISIHGIVKNNKDKLITEELAMKKLLQFIRNAKIVGHHIQFDIQMINLALQNLQLPKLKNRVQDTSDLYLKFKGIQHHPVHKSLDELCDEFNVVKKDRHTALGDAFLTAQIYQRLIIE